MKITTGQFYFLQVSVVILFILNLLTLGLTWNSTRRPDTNPPTQTFIVPTPSPYYVADLLPCDGPKQGICYQFYRIENNKLNIALWISTLSNKNVAYLQINRVPLMCQTFGNNADSIICTGSFFDSGVWEINLFSGSDENLYTGNLFLDLRSATSTPDDTATIEVTYTATTQTFQLPPTRATKNNEQSNDFVPTTPVPSTPEPTTYP